MSDTLNETHTAVDPTLLQVDGHDTLGTAADAGAVKGDKVDNWGIKQLGIAAPIVGFISGALGNVAASFGTFSAKTAAIGGVGGLVGLVGAGLGYGITYGTMRMLGKDKQAAHQAGMIAGVVVGGMAAVGMVAPDAQKATNQLLGQYEGNKTEMVTKAPQAKAPQNAVKFAV